MQLFLHNAKLICFSFILICCILSLENSKNSFINYKVNCRPHVILASCTNKSPSLLPFKVLKELRCEFGVSLLALLGRRQSRKINSLGIFLKFISNMVDPKAKKIWKARWKQFQYSETHQPQNFKLKRNSNIICINKIHKVHFSFGRVDTVGSMGILSFY